jgi:hypothetical protein
VALAEVFPQIAEAVLERNPQLVGAGPSIAKIEMQRDNNGRGEKIALPSARPLPLLPELAPEPEIIPLPVAAAPAAPAPPPAPMVAPPPVIAPAPPRIIAPPPPVAAVEFLPDEAERAPLPPTRWQYEPPEADLEEPVAPEPPPVSAAAPVAPEPPIAPVLDEHDDDDAFAGSEPATQHDVEPPMTGSSFDAALESLSRRMERAKLTTDFVRSLLIVDNVIDVGEAAMRWAGMPNKHERSLTSEVFFALAEWGFLAPRADGRYRVLHAADDDPAV